MAEIQKAEAQENIVLIAGAHGYFFDIINQHAISITNNITDNFLENGTAVQDCITHNPVVVTISGLVGEKVYTPPDKVTVTNHGTSVGTKLTMLGELLPRVSNMMQVVKQNANFVKDTVDRYYHMATNLIDPPRKTEIEYFTGTIEYVNLKVYQVYQRLKAFSDANQSFVVETPFNTFSNMYIQTLNLTQGDTNYVSDLEITFKQVDFSNIITTAADQNVLSQYAQAQQSEETNCGKATTRNSIAYDMLYKR